MSSEAVVAAPRELAHLGGADGALVFASERAVVLVRPDHVETIPIDATGPVTAFAVSEGANLFAVAARSENPTVLVVDGATHAIRTSIQGAASLEVDSIAISRDGTRILTFSSDEGSGAIAWNGISGEPLPGAAAALPAAPTLRSSFCPQDRTLACATTHAGIYFWHVVPLDAHHTRFELHAVPGILLDDTPDRIAVAQLAKDAFAGVSSASSSMASAAAVASSAGPSTSAGSLGPAATADATTPPAGAAGAAGGGSSHDGGSAAGVSSNIRLPTGLLTPDSLAAHGLAAAIDVASAAPDPATAAGLVPSTTVLMSPHAAEGSLVGPSGAQLSPTADTRPGTAVSTATSAGASSAAGGLTAPWDAAAAVGMSTLAQPTWCETLTSGSAAARWTARRRFLHHAWLPGRRVVASTVAGDLLVFNADTGECDVNSSLLAASSASGSSAYPLGTGTAGGLPSTGVHGAATTTAIAQTPAATSMSSRSGVSAPSATAPRYTSLVVLDGSSGAASTASSTGASNAPTASASVLQHAILLAGRSDGVVDVRDARNPTILLNAVRFHCPLPYPLGLPSRHTPLAAGVGSITAICSDPRPARASRRRIRVAVATASAGIFAASIRIHDATAAAAAIASGIGGITAAAAEAAEAAAAEEAAAAAAAAAVSGAAGTATGAAVGGQHGVTSPTGSGGGAQQGKAGASLPRRTESTGGGSSASAGGAAASVAVTGPSSAVGGSASASDDDAAADEEAEEEADATAESAEWAARERARAAVRGPGFRHVADRGTLTALLLPGPSAAVLAIRPLPSLSSSHAAQSDSSAIVAILDAAGRLALRDASRSLVEITRRAILEPPDLALTGGGPAAILSPDSPALGAGVGSGGAAATLPTTTAGTGTGGPTSGGSGAHYGTAGLSMPTPAAVGGAATLFSGPGMPAPLTSTMTGGGGAGGLSAGRAALGTCLDTHPFLSLVAVGSASGCVHVFMATENTAGAGRTGRARAAAVTSGAAAPELCLVPVSVHRAHASSVSAVAFAPLAREVLMASVSDEDGAVCILRALVSTRGLAEAASRNAAQAPTAPPSRAGGTSSRQSQARPPHGNEGKDADDSSPVKGRAATRRPRGIREETGDGVDIRTEDGNDDDGGSKNREDDEADLELGGSDESEDAEDEDETGALSAIPAALIPVACAALPDLRSHAGGLAVIGMFGRRVSETAAEFVVTLSDGTSVIVPIDTASATGHDSYPCDLSAAVRVSAPTRAGPFRESDDTETGGSPLCVVSVAAVGASADAMVAAVPTAPSAATVVMTLPHLATSAAAEAPDMSVAPTPGLTGGEIAVAVASTLTPVSDTSAGPRGAYPVAAASLDGSLWVSLLSPPTGTASASAASVPRRVALVGDCGLSAVSLTADGRFAVAGGTLGSVFVVPTGVACARPAVGSGSDAESAALARLRAGLTATAAVIGPSGTLGVRASMVAAHHTDGRPPSASGSAPASASSAGPTLINVPGDGEMLLWQVGVGLLDSGETEDNDEEGAGGFGERINASPSASVAAFGLARSGASPGPGSIVGGAGGGLLGDSGVGMGRLWGGRPLPRVTTSTRWVLERVEARAAAAAEGSRTEFRQRLQQIRGRLQDLLAFNAQAPEAEQLARDEFAVDEAGAVAMADEARRRADARRAALRAEIAADAAKAAAIRRECWDSMDVHKAVVRAFANDAVVHNIPIRRLARRDVALLDRLTLLRRVEQAEQAESAADLVDTLPNGDVVWSGLVTDLPQDATWVVNAGLLPPSLDPVALDASLAEREASSAAAAAAAAAAATAPAPSSSAAGGVGGKSGSDPSAVDDATTSAAASESEDAAGSAGSGAQRPALGRTDHWEGSKVLRLLYHPLACRTAIQRRAQIRLLEQLCREVARTFNARFDRIAKAKREEMARIQEKTARMAAIQKIISIADPLFRPDMAPDEKADSILQPTASEIGVEPWEDSTSRAAREEAERRRREEAERNRDDAPERALQDMMNGTLREKDEVERAEDAMEALRRDWMATVREEAMTPDQAAEMAAFRAAEQVVEKRREERRAALEAEFRRIKHEVKEAVDEFDTRVAALRDDYIVFRRCILQQELYAHRLAAAVAGSDANLEREQFVLERAATLNDDLSRETAALAAVAPEVEAAEARLRAAREADSHVDKHMREAVRRATDTAPPDPETMKLLVAVFRARHPLDALERAMRDALAGRGALLAAASAVSGPSRGQVTAAASVLPAEAADVEAEMARRALADLPASMIPEGLEVGVTVHPAVWDETLRQRRAKIEAELAVASAQRQVDLLQSLARRLEAAIRRTRARIATLDEERATLLRANALTANDVDVIVRMEQGRDEVSGLAVVPDYADALLVPQRVIDRENHRIRRVGTVIAKRLESIRDVRTDLRYRGWMRRYAEGRLRDREEWYQDVQLLRVTRELQEFVAGKDLAAKQKTLAVRAEAQGRYLRVAHSKSADKMKRSYDHVEKQVEDRAAENRRLAEQIDELERVVAVRRGIVEARERGAQGGTDPRARAERKMSTLVGRSRLVATAKAQAEELEALRTEVARLRKKTFPLFPTVPTAGMTKRA